MAIHNSTLPRSGMVTGKINFVWNYDPDEALKVFKEHNIESRYNWYHQMKVLSKVLHAQETSTINATGVLFDMEFTSETHEDVVENIGLLDDLVENNVIKDYHLIIAGEDTILAVSS